MSTHTFPTRRISETLLDFAEPVMSVFDGQATDEQLHKGLTLAVTIWNCFVLDGARGTTTYQDMIRARFGDAWKSQPILREHVERRQKLFHDDMRAISDFQVYRKNGELRIRAEARSPYSSSPAGPAQSHPLL